MRYNLPLDPADLATETKIRELKAKKGKRLSDAVISFMTRLLETDHGRYQKIVVHMSTEEVAQLRSAIREHLDQETKKGDHNV